MDLYNLLNNHQNNKGPGNNGPNKIYITLYNFFATLRHIISCPNESSAMTTNQRQRNCMMQCGKKKGPSLLTPMVAI